MEFIKKLLSIVAQSIQPQEHINLGVNDELSPEELIEQSEAVGQVASAEFRVKKRSEWRTFVQQFQNTTSACVAFTTAKIALILYFLKTGRVVKFSPAWYYTQRKNKPAEGMFFGDIVTLAGRGSVLYDLLPCEGITESAINAIRIEEEHKVTAPAFALPSNWITVQILFDRAASTVEITKKGIMCWFKIHRGEWFGNEIPKVISRSEQISGHSVTIVDAFTYNGVEYLLIEDSADRIWQKLITREYFNARCYLLAYPINFKFSAGSENKPIYDGSIISIQKCFRYEGFFPLNIPYAENWGKITTESAIKFQAKYGLTQSGIRSKQLEDTLKEMYI